MHIIRQIIGIIYILCILIIALDVMNYLLMGLVPLQLRGLTETIMNSVDSITKILCYPIGYLYDISAKYLPPFINKILPVTDTGVFGAKLAWIPIFSLFIYTSIMKYIDNIMLSIRLKKLQQENENIMFIDQEIQNSLNNIDEEHINIDNNIQGETK